MRCALMIGALQKKDIILDVTVREISSLLT